MVSRGFRNTEVAMASIFTKIIQGELPAFRIYEDEEVISFLTIDPIRAGHALIVPKVEIDSYMNVPEPHYSAVFQLAQKLGKAIQSATDCERVGLAVQGFEVRHFHLHLIPMWGPEDFDFRKAKRMDNEQLKLMQEKIVSRLRV
jgi:histidine triad (HIT) family protein